MEVVKLKKINFHEFFKFPCSQAVLPIDPMITLALILALYCQGLCQKHTEMVSDPNTDATGRVGSLILYLLITKNKKAYNVLRQVKVKTRVLVQISKQSPKGPESKST